MTTWREAAEEALDELIESGEEFCADDLIAVVEQPDLTHAPNSRNNAIGAIFREASVNRRIEMVGTRCSSTPTRKGGLIRVWRGLR